MHHQLGHEFQPRQSLAAEGTGHRGTQPGDEARLAVFTGLKPRRKRSTLRRGRRSRGRSRQWSAGWQPRPGTGWPGKEGAHVADLAPAATARSYHRQIQPVPIEMHREERSETSLLEILRLSHKTRINNVLVDGGYQFKNHFTHAYSTTPLKIIR